MQILFELLGYGNFQPSAKVSLKYTEMFALLVGFVILSQT